MDLVAADRAPLMRIRAWPGAASVAHLVLRDHVLVPSTDDVTEWVERCRSAGFDTVRTGALAPSAAQPFLATGFRTIDRLALLSIDLPVTSAGRRSFRSTRPLRPYHRDRAVDVDQRAFGSVWGHDRHSLADIERATPEHRSRIIVRDRRVVAFAISGRARRNGYLQRLAVDPTHRRAGLATTLVLDALDWMATKADRAYVNTGVDNVAARELYQRIGFRLEPHELVVLEHTP